ncbi:hypothetical protein FA13DRAFT_1778417 [Coprinellus micaceus]|uniref:Uncharacterized protein n=1 Tax=Coprinellus micaceus TaxID=71717 RepID=A0A4Y7SN44_COPMI|nr:hypothetical protein FA13DRAFT_1778417 [Coprinellus micaceus]
MCSPKQQQQQQQPQHQQQQDAMQQDERARRFRPNMRSLPTTFTEPLKPIATRGGNTAVATDNAVKSPAPPPAQQQSASAAITGNTPNQNFPYPYPFVHTRICRTRRWDFGQRRNPSRTSHERLTAQAVDAPPPAPQPHSKKSTRPPRYRKRSPPLLKAALRTARARVEELLHERVPGLWEVGL